MENDQTRDEVLSIVVDLYVDGIGCISKDQVHENTHLVYDFKADSDDVSFFVVEVEKYFDMRLTQAEWSVVATIGQVVDLVMRYRGVRVPREKQTGIFGWFRDWISIKY